MNNIYKVIWSKAKNCYVVVSEIARSHTKSATGSEKIGGVTRRSLLASLMALSLLCGGWGAASASLEVVDQSGTAGTVTIYTKDEVDKALEAKGAATDVASNTANIAANKDNINKLDTKKLDKDLANSTFATKDALNDLEDAVNNKVDESVVETALDGKADKADTLAGYGIKDAYTKGDVDNKLNEKADAANVFTKDQTYTRDQVNTKLADYAKTTDVNTALAGKANVGDSYTKAEADGQITTAKNELGDKITANTTKIDANKTAIDDLKTKAATTENTLTNLSGRMAAAESDIDGLQADMATAKSDIGTLKADVSTAKSDINSLKMKDTELTGKIEAEIANRITSDTALDNKINAEIANRITSDTALDNKIDTEIQDRKDAIKATNDRTGGIARNTEGTQTTIEGIVKVDNQGNVKDVKGLSAETITTTGDAAIGGTLGVTGATTLNGALTANGEATFKEKVTVEKDLAVNGKLNVGEIYLENNKLEATGKKHDSATSITADGISNLAKVTELGHTTESQFTHNEKGTFNYAKDGDTTDWKESTSNVTADGVKTEAKDSKGNRTNTSQTASENKTYLEDKDSKNTNSTIDTAKGYDKTIKGENGETSAKQDELNITNTAQKGTITNDAKDIVNNATGNMTNTVGADLTTTVGGNELHEVTGTKTENVTGKVTENYKAGQETNVTGDQDIYVTGKQTNKIDGEQVNTIGGDQTTTVEGNVKEDYKKDLTTTVGGNELHEVTGTKTENVTGKVMENYNGGQETNVIGNQDIKVSGTQTTTATDINRNASSSMVDKVDNAYGTNTETKEAGKTTTDVSIKGTGEKGQYIRGANESRDYLIKGTLMNSETKTAEATSTEITDATNKASTRQDAKNLAGSVTNGTETGVSGIHANDDGSVSIDSAVAGGGMSSVINQKKDSIQSAVGDGTNSTVIRQDKDNVTIASSNGTVAIVGKDIVNNASESITNKAKTMDTTVTGKATESYGELDTTVTGQATENFNGGLNTKVTGAENHTVTGKQTNTVEGGQENIISGGQINKITGDQTTTVTGKVTENYKAGQATNVTGNQDIHVTGKQTNKIDGDQENTIGGNQTTTVTGDISNKAKNITNEASNSITDKVGDHTRVLDSDGITDTVGGSTFKQRIDKIMMESKNVSIKAEETLTNEAKVITNKASEVINNEAVNINNTATGIITSKASEIKNQADKLISNKVGENTWENMENGKITTSIKDGAKQNLTQSDAAGTTQSTVDGGKSTVTIQNADGLADAVTDGTNTSVQNQTASAIAAAVKDGAGNENASVANATTSVNTIKSGSKANTVISTADGTSFINSEAAAPVGDGTEVKTTIKGNTITTGKVTMDYAEVMKDIGVRGNANIAGKTTTGSLEVKGESKLTGDVTMESNATVKKDLTVEGNTNLKNTKVDGTLDVTQKATFGDSVSIAKDLSVDGNATIKGDVTAKSYKVGDKTYISAAGINANDQKITNVADGSISEGSKDAVNGGQLYTVKNDLEGKVNKVGANAAAMANLHPMEFDPSSKWNIAAAIGNYGSETAAALGAFYRPNDDVMVNLSTAFGTGENMVGGGVSVRLGKGGNKLSREETNALKAQVADLTARMDALLSVLNPNMSKDFPDVPENHWAYEAVSRLAGNDIVQGYPDGEFHGERTMTRYEMAEIIYNALSRGAEAEKELVEEFKPELQAMAASEKATAERAEG